MTLFFFISVIVGMTYIFLYFVLNFDLKKKKLEIEEKKLDLEKRKLELNEEESQEPEEEML